MSQAVSRSVSAAVQAPDEAPGEPTGREHGTYRRYSSGCRCAPCRAAKAAYVRERREAVRASLAASADERAAAARDERALLSAAALREQLHLWDSGYERARRDTLQVAVAIVRTSEPAAALATLRELLTDATGQVAERAPALSAIAGEL